MKKIFYCSALAFCILTLSSCTAPQKRVIPPPQDRGYEQPLPPSVDDLPRDIDTPAPESDVMEPRTPPYLDISGDDATTIEEVTEEVAIPSMNYINDRIFEYSRKLDTWKELDNQSLAMNLSQEETEQMVRCFRRLQKVLNGYSILREDFLQNRLSSEEGGVSSTIIQDLQTKDIEFLESPCGRMLAGTEDKGAGWGQREEVADLTQLETRIDRYAENQEYEEVVQVWLQIPPSQVDRVDLRSRLLYGNALMFLHQEQQAAEVYQQIVDQMSASKEQSTDLISLRKVLADLYTASGNYSAAETQYQKISQDYEALGSLDEWSNLQLSILKRSLKGSPELTEYSGLLRNFLGFIPEKDGYKIVWQAESFLMNYPYSAVSSNVDIIKARAQIRADEWLNGFLEKVDALAGEKRFAEAMELIETIPEDIIDENQKNELNTRNENLILAEAVERETVKLSKVQDLQRNWNSGMLLVKAERFDEAIALFTEMLDSEYSLKAENKIAEVSLLAAKADRRKAADLFIRFTKTTDFESQKKLLVESRRLLKDILVKYPEVEITQKVEGNIVRVEQEMNALDPTLLQMVDGGGLERVEQTIDPFQNPDPVVTPESPQSPIRVSPIE